MKKHSLIIAISWPIEAAQAVWSLELASAASRNGGLPSTGDETSRRGVILAKKRASS